MRTTLLTAVTPLSDDFVLMDDLRLATDRAVPNGIALCIGLEGPGKQVYRIIDTDGLLETIAVFERLHAFGFTSTGGRTESGRVLQRVFRRDRVHEGSLPLI